MLILPCAAFNVEACWQAGARLRLHAGTQAWPAASHERSADTDTWPADPQINTAAPKLFNRATTASKALHPQTALGTRGRHAGAPALQSAARRGPRRAARAAGAPPLRLGARARPGRARAAARRPPCRRSSCKECGQAVTALCCFASVRAARCYHAAALAAKRKIEIRLLLRCLHLHADLRVAAAPTCGHASSQHPSMGLASSQARLG